MSRSFDRGTDAKGTARERFPQIRYVAVVGGGVAGTSVAWQLAKRGVDVALLEGEHLAWGASGRNGAHVGVETNYDGGVTARRLRSMEIMEELEREVGDFRWDRTGRRRLWMGEEGEHPLPDAETAAPGSTVMTGDEARAFYPYLSRCHSTRFTPAVRQGNCGSQVTGDG